MPLDIKTLFAVKYRREAALLDIERACYMVIAAAQRVNTTQQLIEAYVSVYTTLASRS